MATITPTPSKSKFSILKFANSGKWLVILAVIILAAGGFYLYRHHQNQQKAKAAAQPYAYTYSKTTVYKLAGFMSGSGVKLNLPAAFGAAANSAAKASQAQFSQTLVKNGQTANIAQVAVASVYAGNAPSATYLKTLGQSIVNPKSTNYTAVLGPVKNYVTQRLSTSYNVTFATPQTLTAGHIKTNAWSVDFTATPKTTAATSASTIAFPPLSGQVVLAVGKMTFYYFLQDAVNYNWQSNQNFWQGIVNSLQIDQ